ncbi:hypothetical protein Tco_1397263 [Tanacetum coccineum]
MLCMRIPFIVLCLELSLRGADMGETGQTVKKLWESRDDGSWSSYGPAAPQIEYGGYGQYEGKWVDRSRGENEVGREVSLAAVVRNVRTVPGKRWGYEIVMTVIELLEMEYQLEKLKYLLPLKKSGEDGDGGRVNVGPGVDVRNNKSRIRLSGIKLTDEDVGVLQALGYPLQLSDNLNDDNPAKQFDVLSYLDSDMYPRESPRPMREMGLWFDWEKYLPQWVKAASLHNLIFQFDDMDKLIRKE